MKVYAELHTGTHLSDKFPILLLLLNFTLQYVITKVECFQDGLELIRTHQLLLCGDHASFLLNFSSNCSVFSRYSCVRSDVIILKFKVFFQMNICTYRLVGEMLAAICRMFVDTVVVCPETHVDEKSPYTAQQQRCYLSYTDLIVCETGLQRPPCLHGDYDIVMRLPVSF